MLPISVLSFLTGAIHRMNSWSTKVHVRKREAERKRGRVQKNLPYLTGNNSSWLRSICCTIFFTITISQTPLVSLVSGWEKKVHFLSPSKYRTQCIISLQIYTFKHVGRRWWGSSVIILGDNNTGAANIMKVVPFVTHSLTNLGTHRLSV